MNDKQANRLTAKLAPESVYLTLTRAGSFLCAYELIKSEIIDSVHDFFIRGIDHTGFLYDEARYQRHVLSRDPKSKYRASCAWLVDMQALTPEHVETLEKIHSHRHEIAHELPRLLIDPDFEVKTDLLLAAAECIRVLGVFWGSIAVDTSSDSLDGEVDYDGIKSGSYLLVEYLISIAGLGPNPEV